MDNNNLFGERSMDNKKDIQLSHLVDMEDPAAVFEEVKYNFIQFYPFTEFSAVRGTFGDFNALFEGKYAGYRGCNTRFHDKLHTTDALLAISRLIDGYNLSNKKPIPVELVKIALIATILHDSGYIQKDDDVLGTGAKHTLKHVERSIEFIDEYFAGKGLAKADFASAKNMVSCTGIGLDISKIEFASKPEKILGLMLGTADLIGQMSSRTYLERLLFLYWEFKEGNIPGYDSEFEMLRKTIGFYESTRVKFTEVFEDIEKCLIHHFRKRYGIDEDLYYKAMHRQIEYLRDVVRQDASGYRKLLRRKVKVVGPREE